MAIFCTMLFSGMEPLPCGFAGWTDAGSLSRLVWGRHGWGHTEWDGGATEREDRR
ncbi:hypothetical protein AA14337_2725 [Acetobacter malorum DSM 14337]|uniref:Transposase n=1 Tax=Acetobacter malorum DSM 14337 TaxID=1307910 RepID=A0ABQ0PXC4_9PROT|nr:hypothetical protein AA14337_2725 [Acetobacter malorum DSM 14337]